MPTTVRLPEEAENRLNFLAKQTGRTKSFYIKKAILGQLDEMEDIYMGEATLERVRQGKEKTYSLGDVRKELDLES